MASTTTRGQYFVMINNPCWYPSLRCLVMAGLTGVGTGDVATTLTRGEGAVMATDAIRRNRCVIHRSAQPRCGHVTHIALIIRRDMRAGFTRCRGTVMTRAASTDNLPMIYRYSRRPSYGTWRVAGITDRGRTQMPCRQQVATGAQTVDLGVIHPVRRHRRPKGGEPVMAGVTDVAGIDMAGRLTTGGNTVMTGKTITHESTVIGSSATTTAGGPSPGQRGMTNIAFRGGCDVARALAGCRYPIVTTAAYPDDLIVIHPVGRYRCPQSRKPVMTGVTNITGINMVK